MHIFPILLSKFNSGTAIIFFRSNKFLSLLFSKIADFSAIWQ